MIKYQMNKILLFLIIVSVFTTSVYTKESTLAVLREVYSNGMQKFSVGSYDFLCRTYGVLTLDELYEKSVVGSVCQKSIREFYAKNPTTLSFTDSLLKQRQLYNIEFKDNRCILYANGQVVLSEILLRNGLAVLKPRFKDKEYRYLLNAAQNYAKKSEIGLFKNKITNKCISELYVD